MESWRESCRLSYALEVFGGSEYVVDVNRSSSAVAFILCVCFVWEPSSYTRFALGVVHTLDIFHLAYLKSFGKIILSLSLSHFFECMDVSVCGKSFFFCTSDVYCCYPLLTPTWKYLDRYFLSLWHTHTHRYSSGSFAFVNVLCQKIFSPGKRISRSIFFLARKGAYIFFLCVWLRINTNKFFMIAYLRVQMKHISVQSDVYLHLNRIRRKWWWRNNNNGTRIGLVDGEEPNRKRHFMHQWKFKIFWVNAHTHIFTTPNMMMKNISQFFFFFISREKS